MWSIETISLLVHRSKCSYRSIRCTPLSSQPPSFPVCLPTLWGLLEVVCYRPTPPFFSLCVTSPLGLSVGLRLGFITPLPRRCIRHNKCKYMQWFPRFTPRVIYRHFPCLRISFHTLWCLDIIPLSRKTFFPYSSAEIIIGLQDICIFKYRL